MYKERILGLEEQVSLLREQLSKEARSRRSYILSSQTINADVSELRQQLGDSLDMVHNASRAHLQSGLLDREASRLEAAIARQPPEITSRLTPSKRSPGSPVVPRARSSGPIRSHSEFRRSSSVENLPTSSSQNTSQADLHRNTFGGGQVTPGVGSLHTSTPDHHQAQGRRGPQLRDSLLGARTDLLSTKEHSNTSRGRTLDVGNSSRGRFGGLRRSLAQDFETAGRLSTNLDPAATQDYFDVLNITT